MPEIANKREHIVKIARQLIGMNVVILDTETTGLGQNDEIVEIAIIDTLDTFQFSALVQPLNPIPAEATAVHGITNEMVAHAYLWRSLWPDLRYQLTVRKKHLLDYNSAFDARMIEQTSKQCAVEPGYFEWDCLMNMWMEYHGLPRWVKQENVCRQIGIPVGGHRALGDAKAAREVLRWLARQEVSTND